MKARSHTAFVQAVKMLFRLPLCRAGMAINNNGPNTSFHYAMLISTNIALLLSNWTSVATNSFNMGRSTTRIRSRRLTHVSS